MTAPKRGLSAAQKLLFWLVAAVAGWATVGAYVLLWLSHPSVATVVTTHGAAFSVGLLWRDRRRATLVVVSDWHDEEIEAIKLADLRRDSGDVPAVTAPPYDWATELERLPRALPDAWRPANPGIGRWIR